MSSYFAVGLDPSCVVFSATRDNINEAKRKKQNFSDTPVFFFVSCTIRCDVPMLLESNYLYLVILATLSKPRRQQQREHL